MEGSGGGSKYLPLFETKPFRGRKLFRLYALSVFVGICFIGVFRVMNLQTMLQVGSSKLELWAWIGTFLSELWFALYWISTVVVRWNPIYRQSFNDRLSTRYEKELPAVDIFVCTADPVLEPPLMVVNTVLSVMAYDYPSDKLSVYLSDDGGSKLTFYALLEASRFSKLWLPFCRKFKVEPRSPEAYFRAEPQPDNTSEWQSVKIGLKYGSAVEDILTGLSIQCRGWKSVFFNPEQHAFLGIAPTALLEVLVQHKRWSEGDLQILLSRHCPFIQGHKRIPLRLQCSYCIYLLWAPSFLATLYFVTIPSLCLLSHVSLFPEICNPWAIPYCYVLITSWGYSLGEFLWAGGTLHGWWNERRMCLFKRCTSYMFGFLAVILEKLGFSKASFAVTAKVADDDVYQRYQKEAMEFGENSSMFLIIAIIAQVNLVSLGVGLLRATRFMDKLSLQTALSGILVTLNLPVYDGLFFRMDKGRIPSRVTCQSLIVTVSACSLALFQNI